VNLGPADALLPYIPPNPQSNGLGYNPRCIIRDVSSYVSRNWTKDSDIYDLIVGYTDILSFQDRMQGDFNTGYLGIHSGGHYTDGGDPGGDFFASPGDPYFFFYIVSESLINASSNLAFPSFPILFHCNHTK
jgi:tyrosinase